MRRMIVTTTQSIEGRKITDYRGIVVGEAILGANVFRDIFASITDIIGAALLSFVTLTLISGLSDFPVMRNTASWLSGR